VELRDLFWEHPEWFAPWSGTLFRFQTLNFFAPRDVLSGEGAKWRGGRWNLPGLATLYGSTTDTTALEECKAIDRYYCVETKSPRLLVAIEASLMRVLNLTSPEIRGPLDNIMLTELKGEDWRKLQAAGRESFTQAIGRAVATTGGSGLLVRSAAVHQGINGVVFPRACAKDLLKVVEGEKLEALGVKGSA
jgi:RES domain-containing protein